jgi:leucyl-tRNA synthetase
MKNLRNLRNLWINLPSGASYQGSEDDMSKSYDPKAIEAKWQARWEESGLHRSLIDRSKPKHYALTMLPYPSGDLHIGHWYAMAPSDARARFMRMNGYNVLFPMGFDAFGLPAENAAIKRNIHPAKWTWPNIERMRGQLRSMGAMFDWEREVASCDPDYYRWTQWFFKKLLEHGLAYRKLSAVDFCPQCNTTLAREQVWGDDRHCERCGTPVIKKDLEQWFFRTTNYAEELLDFSQISWPERVKTMQTNWIGRSTGAEVFSPPKTRTRYRFSPPGRTRSGGRLSWFWPRNIRWWRKLRRRGSARPWKPTATPPAT